MMLPVATEKRIPRTALSDVKYVEKVSPENPIAMNLYRSVGEAPNHLRFRYIIATKRLHYQIC